MKLNVAETSVRSVVWRKGKNCGRAVKDVEEREDALTLVFIRYHDLQV